MAGRAAWPASLVNMISGKRDACQGRRLLLPCIYPRQADRFPLFRHSVPEEDSRLGIDYAPILPPSRPLFRDVYHRQIQHLEQAVICGENRFGLGYFSELTVESFDGVGGIDQPPHPLRILEIGAKVWPIHSYD